MDIPLITLNDGQTIPQVGLGLWRVTDESKFTIMFDTAIEVGYRHFDTAQAYHNEAMLGAALKRHDIQRQDVFLTTKIAVQNFGKHRAEASFAASLERLKTDYVDLLLLHFPVPLLRQRTWQTLEKLQDSGQVRSIGVSNFTVRHLQRLQQSTKIVPAVNQVELHVFLQQPELLAYCRQNQITIEAYSPLAHGRNMTNPTVKLIAQKHGKSYAQVLLRWCLEQDAIVIPKTATPGRLRENYDIFDFHLDKDDLMALSAENKDLRTCWNPTHVP